MKMEKKKTLFAMSTSNVTFVLSISIIQLDKCLNEGHVKDTPSVEFFHWHIPPMGSLS